MNFPILAIMENPAVPNYSIYIHRLYFLPIKVVNSIFSYLSPKSRQELRAVCLYWKYLLDEILIPEVDNECYRQTIKLRDEIRVRVRNFTTEFQEIVMFAHTIRKLEFWDVVVSYNLINFLGECSFVQEINFANVTLDSRRRIKCPEGLCLPKVKVIAFAVKWNLEPTVDELILFDLLRQVKFGQLEEVKISSPRQCAIGAGVEISLATVNKIELPSGIKSTGVLAFLIKNHQSMRKLIVASHELCPFGSPIKEMANELDQLQFEEIKCYIRKAGKFNGNESLIIEDQRALKRLDVRIYFYCWPALEKAIRASASTLVEVTVNTFFGAENEGEDELEFQEYRTHGIDASIFKDSCQLESLYLNVYTPIFNFSSLPDSIRSLYLDWKAVSTQEDFLAIASKLCNLKSFTMTECVSTTVNADVVQAFTQIQTLEQLRIEACKADEDGISEFAKSQDAFEINFDLWDDDPDRYGTLTISKKLTPSEPHPIQFS